MTSIVEICNLALDRLGSKNIMALDESSKQARTCNNCYEAIRDATLRDYPWQFATKRHTFAQLAATPEYEYDHAYSLPSDFIRLVELYEMDSESWEIEDNKIVCNVDTLYGKYIYRLTDPTKFAPDFVIAYSKHMAAHMAYKITGDRNLAQEVRGEYVGLLGMSEFVDSSEQSDQKLAAEDWISARV